MYSHSSTRLVSSGRIPRSCWRPSSRTARRSSARRRRFIRSLRTPGGDHLTPDHLSQNVIMDVIEYNFIIMHVCARCGRYMRAMRTLHARGAGAICARHEIGPLGGATLGGLREMRRHTPQLICESSSDNDILRSSIPGFTRISRELT